ncbi:hypothetical protein JW930_00050 [Candidatus Woesearchaeota archaeon]|nr:hypothetical protein [Candidatus Woesearchaeota archaeon]
MKKKGVSLSLNAIVIAAIALIVLVVLVYIFTTRSRDFVWGTRNCIGQGGECKNGCDSSYEVEYSGTNCADLNPDEPNCCVPMLEGPQAT